MVRGGLFAEAQKHLQQIELRDALEADQVYLLARCAVALDEQDEAIQRLAALVGYHKRWGELDKSVALAPEKVEAYTLLAGILQRRSSTPRTIATCTSSRLCWLDAKKTSMVKSGDWKRVSRHCPAIRHFCGCCWTPI